jgi:multidrug efflux pump subunit AcrA (membrane-fusion protein)
MQLNTITQQQALKLAQAQEMLAQADALMQEGLGHCDFCFEMHCLLENLQADLAQIADQQVA